MQMPSRPSRPSDRVPSPLLTRLTRLALLALLGTGAPLSATGPQTLVADLDQTTAARSSFPDEFHRAGDRVVFAASDPLHGRELWSTGRDLATFELLVDANPGTASSAPRFEAEIGGVLYYSTGAPAEPALWVTDGTPAGTRLVRDQDGSAIVLVRSDEDLPVRLGDRLALVGYGVTSGADGVWAVSTDGSAVRLRSAFKAYGGGFLGLAVARDRLFFLEQDDETNERTIWSSDGTAAGARVVVAGLPGGRDAAGSSAERYFFASRNEAGADVLWATDGSAAGTLALATFGPYPEIGPSRLYSGASRVYFVASEAGDSSRLWVSDGSPGGTFALDATLGPGAFGTFEPLGAWFGDRFVFQAYWADRERVGLFAHAGSGAAPTLLPTPHPEQLWSAFFVALDDALLFNAWNAEGSAEEVWATDGTPASTRQVSHLCPGVCDLYSLEFGRRVGGQALFQITYDESMFRYNWYTVVSDGTGSGTRVLDDSAVGAAVRASSAASWAARVDGGFLVAGRERYRSGIEVWHLDLSGGGGRLVANLDPEIGRSRPRNLFAIADRLFWVVTEYSQFARTFAIAGVGQPPVRQFAPGCPDGVAAVARLGDAVVFRDTSTYGHVCLAAYDLDHEDWTTLVASTGVEPIEGERPFVAAGGRIYFRAREDGQTERLWATDGTPAGTGPWNAAGLPQPFALVGATSTHLYLRDVDFSHALFALPLAGGTAQQVAELSLPWLFGPDTELAAAGTRLFFTLREPDEREALHVSNGTFLGTHEVWSSFGAEARLLDLFPWGESVLFLVGSDRMTLWRSDGTTGGTFAVADLGPLAADADDLHRRDAIAYDGRLYFAAESDALGAELWSTDGTAEGTVAFDLVPGPGSSAPRGLAIAGGTLFFAADDPAFGREVWASDGTPAGTRRVTDIAAGAASAEPEELVAAGSTLYFAADDGFRGRELWSLDAGAAERCVPGARRLCLRDGRFAVEGAWRDFAGHAGAATAIPRGEASGAFWFFDPTNVEAVVKILDGGPVNDRFWLYYAALSNVAYDLQVTDTAAHVTKRYSNPEGRFASVGDVEAFEAGAGLPAMTATQPAFSSALAGAASSVAPTATGESSTGLCAPTATRLCLQQERFAVEARWRDFLGNQGVAQAMPWTPDTGLLWFFDAAIPELVVKVLDGGAVNGRFWVLSGALSNVEYTLTVTDLLTGAVREYYNPAGTYASFGDIDAF